MCKRLLMGGRIVRMNQCKEQRMRPLESTSVISLMLAVQDVPAAIEWYQRALAAPGLWPRGSVAGLELAGAPFSRGQPKKNGWEPPANLGITTTRIELFCDDPDAVVARAIEAGASDNGD